MEHFNLNLSDESLEFLKTNFYSSNNKSFRSCGNVWYRLGDWVDSFYSGCRFFGGNYLDICAIAQLGPTGAKYNVLDGVLIGKSVDYQTDQGIYNDYFFLAENEAIAQVVESRLAGEGPEVYIKVLAGLPTHIIDDLVFRVGSRYVVRVRDRALVSLKNRPKNTA